MAAVYVGCRGISGLTAGLFFARILLQQLTTALYEELNYRFLILEGYFHGNKSVWSRLLYGWHHSAQKSMMMRPGSSSTSVWKLSSVSVTISVNVRVSTYGSWKPPP